MQMDEKELARRIMEFRSEGVRNKSDQSKDLQLGISFAGFDLIIRKKMLP